MRLTLRTLLAYLDDTLEPLEIKQIGQKVAESETAQELISRIKQVTRRRRLTTPPATGPNAFDPNVVSDYLDNELSNEQVAELEKICLESDVHLAEVAACHQILTLVLGEPAVVPPPAKERMYALVKGREAIPFRKAAASGAGEATPSSADHDADEMFLLGLPFYRRGSWLRWALPLAGVILLTVVGVAIWQSVYGLQNAHTNGSLARGRDVANDSSTKPDQNANRNTEKNGEGDKGKDPSKDEKKGSSEQGKKEEKATGNGTSDKKTNDPNAGSQTDNSKTEKSTTKEPDKSSTATIADRQAKPSTDRLEVGQYHTDSKGPPSLLVQRKDTRDQWRRLKPGSRLSTVDQLVSLPGYASEVWLDCGARLLLRGHVREFTPPNEAKLDYLQESAVVLHKPQGTDADFTLDRGRIYVSNHNNNAITVRMRFEDKAWDLTLHPQAEVVVDLLKYREEGEPINTLILFLLSGQAGLALENDQYPNLSIPGWAAFIWNSLQPNTYSPRRLDKQTVDQFAKSSFAKVFSTASPVAEGMERALGALSQQMYVDKFPLDVFQSVLAKSTNPNEHNLVIYCLASLDAIQELVEVLNTANAIQAPDRDTAIFALRRWLGRGPEQTLKLYNPATKKGLLIQMMFTTSEAERIVQLLRDFSVEQTFEAETYEHLATDLISKKVAIAELARWHLYRLGKFYRVELPAVDKFNAALPPAIREKAFREVTDKIGEGVLPPPLHPSNSRPPTGKGTNSKTGSRPNSQQPNK